MLGADSGKEQSPYLVLCVLEEIVTGTDIRLLGSMVGQEEKLYQMLSS